MCSVIDRKMAHSASDYITTDKLNRLLYLMNIPVINSTIERGTVRTIAHTTFKYQIHTPGMEYKRVFKAMLVGGDTRTRAAPVVTFLQTC